MNEIEQAIKHFENMRDDAVAVLDSGFGNKPNENNILYKNRKLYAELAIQALQEKQERELMRCKNCKYGKNNYLTQGATLCIKPDYLQGFTKIIKRNVLMDCDDFCSFFEKRDDA